MDRRPPDKYLFLCVLRHEIKIKISRKREKMRHSHQNRRRGCAQMSKDLTKTELCRNFCNEGICLYGTRCKVIRSLRAFATATTLIDSPAMSDSCIEPPNLRSSHTGRRNLYRDVFHQITNQNCVVVTTPKEYVSTGRNASTYTTNVKARKRVYRRAIRRLKNFLMRILCCFPTKPLTSGGSVEVIPMLTPVSSNASIVEIEF